MPETSEKIYYVYDPETRRPKGTSKEKVENSSEWPAPSKDYLYDGRGWVFVPAGIRRADLIQRLLEKELQDIPEKYTEQEQQAFVYQYQEALAYLADEGTDTPFLDEALTDKETKKELATKILEKHKAALKKAAASRKARKLLEQALEKQTDQQLLVRYYCF